MLHYTAGELTGLATLQPGEPIEACVLVAPGQRRRGIGRRLVAAARDEAMLLLTSESRCAGGLAFAAALGATPAGGEYRLELAQAPGPVSTPPGLHVREAGLPDVATMAAVSAAAFVDGRAAARARQFRASLRAGRHRYYLAELDGAPVGMLRVSTDDPPVYVTAFGVLPGLQGRGIGRALLTHAITHEPRRPLRIEVATDNPRALGLYQSCGFAITNAYAYFTLQAPSAGSILSRTAGGMGHG